jgi:serine-type D-Ala-D-Ala carboxypeptidase/endopeptidase
MKRKYFPLLLGVFLAASLAAAQQPSATALPSDAEIRKILVDRIDVRHQGVGIVVGVIEPAGRRVVAYGNLDAKGNRPVDGDTIFEIGSATKVFTSLLLADAVQRGEVALSDPVSKYLPGNVKMPERDGRKITLQDLATHTSGLPRLPSNMHPKDPSNPYTDYSVQQLYEFLSSYTLPRDPASQYEYSNLGAGLLGHVLSLRAGSDYEALVRTRITGPLGMKDTAIKLTGEMKKRLAAGHDAQLGRVSNWDLPTLAGAGAIRSTANDLLEFLGANLGYTKSPLAPAMASQLATRRPTGSAGLEIALGWHVISKPDGREIAWHNGGTGGYRSFIGFDPKSRTGVVVLSNTYTESGVDDIGQHLLDPAVPITEAPKLRKKFAIDTKIFDGYVGRYALSPNFIITISRQRNRFFLQATGQPGFEIFPESDRDFFLEAVDAQITFQTDEQNRVTGLILHQNGANAQAKRIEGDAAAPENRKEISVDPVLLERYVGRYAMSPAFIITVTREGDRLFLQATGQSRLELFAASEREFFLEAVDAQVTFEMDGSGRATKLILHQNGMNQPAKRIE